MAKQVKQLGIAQNSIGFNDGDKLQKAVDFILDTYDIRKAMYDPAKIYVRLRIRNWTREFWILTGSH